MKSVILLCLVVTCTVAAPRQDVQSDNRLDEPLSDPELRRTLLRVFAESLKAAAEAGAVAGARSAVNVPVEEIIDLRPPSDGSRSDDASRSEADELLEASEDSNPLRGRGSNTGISFTTPEPPLAPEQPAVLSGEQTPFTINLGGVEPQGSSSNQQFQTGEEKTETRTESAPAQPPAEPTFPGPSPAPPSPTPVAVTVDEATNGAKLSPSDSEDVKRFVNAAKTSDETLGEGIELFQAPLIATFALQQDGHTGRTHSLQAFPVKEHEELLKRERQILSVAGQVVGTQRTGITPQLGFAPLRAVPDLRPTSFDIQQSIQPDFRQNPFQAELVRSVQPDFTSQQQNLKSFESSNNQLLLNDADPHLRRLERQQQELQQQLLNIQRERSALLLQRNTRGSEALSTAASTNPAFSGTIPIFLQPPFF